MTGKKEHDPVIRRTAVVSKTEEGAHDAILRGIALDEHRDAVRWERKLIYKSPSNRLGVVDRVFER